MDIRIQNSIKTIKFIIKDLGFENGKKFSESLGFSRPERIYRILRGQTSISRNLASIINEKNPQYSIDWLLTGFDNIDNNSSNNEVYYEKDGVKFYVSEIINFLVEQEEEFMKRKTYSNIIEIKVAKKVAQITASKKSLLDYLGKS